MTRCVRIGGCALCILGSLLFVALWVRSYEVAERVHGRLWGDKLFLVASKQGTVTALPFRRSFHPDHWNHPDHWKWEIRRYPVENILAFPNGVRTRTSALGFGLTRDPPYSLLQLWGPPRIDSDSTVNFDLGQEESANEVSYSSFVTLRGTGVIVPYWLLVLVTAALASLVGKRRPWQFSLRGLLVAVTFVAVLLALVAALDT